MCLTQHRAVQGARGFTLIEMMAVLVIFGLLTAVALPNFERWYSSTQERVGAGEVAVRLQKLFARAALLGQNFELDAKSASTLLGDGQPALDLPKGWVVAPNQHISVPASGYCTPASIEVVSSAQRVVLDVASGQCEISVRRGVVR